MEVVTRSEEHGVGQALDLGAAVDQQVVTRSQGDFGAAANPAAAVDRDIGTGGGCHRGAGLQAGAGSHRQ